MADSISPNQNNNSNNNNAALVFGASGEQGRAVIEGFVDAGYSPVYGFTSNSSTISDQYLSDALQCVLLEGKLGNPDDVRKALISTKATTIFLTTTTDMGSAAGYDDPIGGPASGGFRSAQDDEYDCIKQFFDILTKVYFEDQLDRTIIFSTRDDVQDLCRIYLEQTGKVWIEPLDDGSIVPHYSAKGRGGKEALKMLSGVDDGNNNNNNPTYPGLNLILLTMPFFYSNFLAFFVPLPNKGQTQWELSASFGDGAIPIDMMNCSDLGQLVVNVAKQSHIYKGQNLRIAAERISMDEIAKQFSELFGKDVIYNPLLPSEVAAMEFPTAPAIAQMCQFLSSNNAATTTGSDDAGSGNEQQQGGLYQHHDVELTRELMGGRKPSKFSDWLLTHSDSTAFTCVGLDRDAPELTRICVFGALSPQGKSVIRGLLADTRKTYEIRATTRQDFTKNPDAQELINLAPQQVSFVHADFDDVTSCHKAVEGMDGAFLVADLHHGDGDTTDTKTGNGNAETEERHVRNIIDACEGTVKHLVFSTMESSDAVNNELPKKELLEFSPKARVASYARSKELSVTFVLMPCYSEVFFDMMDVRRSQNSNGKDKLVLQIPAADNGSNNNNGKVMCMSVDELGPAVANIFDSYECFAGHEIGLVTDFVTVSEVQEIFQDVFTDHTVETETVDTKNWIEARGTYMKDLGQLFAGVSHSDPVRSRHSVAKTFKLVPSATNLRRWVEQNKENPAFREKLGLR